MWLLLVVCAAAVVVVDTEPKNLHVLLIAEARSSSSFTLELLQSISNSFSFFEPFFSYQPSKTPLEALPGSYKTLFNCKLFTQQDLLDRILWSEACLRRNVLDWIDPQTRQRCLNHTLTWNDKFYIQQRCKASSVRIIKTVRFRGYVADELPLDDADLKVIHLIRRPSLISDSWLRKNWLGGQRDLIVDHLCQSMKRKIHGFDHLSARQFMRLRSETVLHNPEHAAQLLFTFLGVDYGTTQQKLVLKSVARSKHLRKNKANTQQTSWPNIQWFDRKFGTTCPDVLKYYGYSEPLSSPPHY
eukprot:m.67568 g.67568  ORF g.67568 m.67568 type:complete len:300 (+) comp19816_c0_seq1:62-961(+)